MKPQTDEEKKVSNDQPETDLHFDTESVVNPEQSSEDSSSISHTICADKLSASFADAPSLDLTRESGDVQILRHATTSYDDKNTQEEGKQNFTDPDTTTGNLITPDLAATSGVETKNTTDESAPVAASSVDENGCQIAITAKQPLATSDALVGTTEGKQAEDVVAPALGAVAEVPPLAGLAVPEEAPHDHTPGTHVEPVDEMDFDCLYGASGLRPVRGGVPVLVPAGVDREELRKGATPRLSAVPEAHIAQVLIHRFRVATLHLDWAQHDAEDEIPLRVGKVKVLLDLIDYVPKAHIKLDETMLQEAMTMVACNLFRALPPKPTDAPVGEGAEEEPLTFDPIWPLLRWVYDFFLRFVVNEVDPRVLKKHVNASFIVRLLELFHSQDVREREYLKTILHRIYAKFMSLRAFIRKAMNHVFHAFVYESEQLAGVAEMLEILGSIINGFAVPLKAEHKVFFAQVLTPMHKVRSLATFHQQLSYCVLQFVEKDPSLAPQLVRGLLRYWPLTSPTKELLFLHELDEILDIVKAQHLREVAAELVTQIASCVASPHYQVAERALNIALTSHLSTVASMAPGCPEAMAEALARAAAHWNSSVVLLAKSALKLAVHEDDDVVEAEAARLRARLLAQDAQRARTRSAHEQQWAALGATVLDAVAKYPPPPPPDAASLLPTM